MKYFTVHGGQFEIPYKNLCTLEVPEEPGWEQSFAEMEVQLLINNPGFVRFHRERFNDYPLNRIRTYYALPGTWRFVQNQ